MNRMGKTRTFLLGLAAGVACLFLLAASGADSDDSADRIGRYQLSMGESKRALIIDTATGVVKVVQDYHPDKNQFNVPFTEMK